MSNERRFVVWKKSSEATIARIKRIHTDGEIHDNMSDPCNPCAFPDGALLQARRGLGAREKARGGWGFGNLGAST